MQSDERVFFKLEGMTDLLEINRLVFEDLPIKNFKNLNLPKILPNLKSLQIRKCPLKSLEGLPLEMTNLTSFSLGSLPHLQNLKGFPNITNNLDGLSIINLPELHSLEGLPSKLPRLYHIRIQDLPKLHSFSGMPSELPRLRNLEIHDVDLFTFRDLPENTPENISSRFHIEIWNYKSKKKEPILFDLSNNTPFSGFGIQDYIVKDFSFLCNFTIDDLKKSGFTFNRCIIHSFEGFPVLPEKINPKDIFYYLDEDYNYEACSLGFGHSTIRSFSGLSLPILKYLLPFLIYNENFDFAPTGRKIYEDCINHSAFQKENWSLESFAEIANCPNPNHRDTLTKYNVDLGEMERFNLMSLVEWKIHKQTQYWETKEQWFYPDKIKLLYEYFKTPIVELAHQYIANPSPVCPLAKSSALSMKQTTTSAKYSKTRYHQKIPLFSK